MGPVSDEPWVLAAIDAEERALARIAEGYGAGLDDGRIARYAGVSVGVVRDVLRERRVRP